MPKDSILEKVLQSRQTHNIEQFNPEEIINLLFTHLNPREQKIVRKRFCLTQNIAEKKQTLESIGTSLKITRERVRQIEKESIHKLQKLDRELGNSSPLRIMVDVIESVLDNHGGAMEEEHLIEKLHEVTLLKGQYRNMLLFLIEKLLVDRLERIWEDQYLFSGWRLPMVKMDSYYKIHDMLYGYIKNKNDTLTIEELFEYVSNKLKDGKNHDDEISTDVLRAYLRLSKKIRPNVFDEWGLSNWPTVKPRHMNDKIYLILKRQKKPLHFREIAQKINDANFDKKRAYPATIHNELILDEKYVLVGKGIYALCEWGYKKGTVLEVIEEILRERSPLSKEEIVTEVLKKRIVKKTTIYLALMNKEKFSRDPNGMYVLTNQT